MGGRGRSLGGYTDRNHERQSTKLSKRPLPLRTSGGCPIQCGKIAHLGSGGRLSRSLKSSPRNRLSIRSKQHARPSRARESSPEPRLLATHNEIATMPLKQEFFASL